MKIIHINANSKGGAARSCLRLHRSLLQAGMESKVLLLHGETIHSEKIFSFRDCMDEKKFSSLCKLEKRKRYVDAWKIRLRGKPVELFTFPESVWKIEDHPLVKEADIIHLHWVSGMIDIEHFFAAIKKPIVWTLHDAWPFTGGFHFDSYFDSHPFEKISKRLLELKKKSYRGKNITLVSPSNYLLEAGRKSEVFQGNKFFHIPYGVSKEIYHPVPERSSLRDEYELNGDMQLWFFAADELGYSRKGADLLVHAFQNWKNEKVKLLIAGSTANFAIPGDERIKLIGHIDDEKKMAQLLNSADALICAPRDDNQPNLIIESLFCGTPVLSTPAGGIPEMITDGINGFLAPAISEEGLKKGFQKIFETTFDRKKISSDAQSIYSSSLQTERYRKIYQELF